MRVDSIEACPAWACRLQASGLRSGSGRLPQLVPCPAGPRPSRTSPAVADTAAAARPLSPRTRVAPTAGARFEVGADLVEEPREIGSAAGRLALGDEPRRCPSAGHQPQPTPRAAQPPSPSRTIARSRCVRTRRSRSTSRPRTCGSVRAPAPAARPGQAAVVPAARQARGPGSAHVPRRQNATVPTRSTAPPHVRADTPAACLTATGACRPLCPARAVMNASTPPSAPPRATSTT